MYWTRFLRYIFLLTSATVANSSRSLREGGTWNLDGYKWLNDFFLTSSEHILWSGCSQLFTSVAQRHYTQFSDALTLIVLMWRIG